MKRELTLSAVPENIEKVNDFVNAYLEETGCPMKAQMQIGLATEEAFVNIVHYAYDAKSGDASIRIERREQPEAVVITFTDQGKPYDPLQKKDPDVTLSAEERQIGGLGVFLIKKMMDEVRYEYRDGKNVLQLQKLL